MTDHDISLDIGFDRQANAKPGSGEYAGLTCGFTVVSQPGNPVVLARRLRIGQRLILTLYDLTEPAGQPPSVAIEHLSLSLEISKAREQPDLQPFELVTGAAAPALIAPWPTYRIFRAHADLGRSTVFDDDYPSWNVHPPDAGAATYPNNQLGSGRESPRATFEIARGGYFYFTLLLEVGWAGARPKLYREDPEMIIDTTL